MANDVLIEMIKALSIESGSVTSPAELGTAYLTDATKNWSKDSRKGCIVRVIKGSGSGQQALVKSNIGHSLQVTPPWIVSLDTTSVYVIFKPEITAELIAILDLVQNLKTRVDAIESRLDTPRYRESSGGGNTGAAYETILNIDARNLGDITIKLANDDPANSLEYRVLMRPEYGVEEEIIHPEDQSIAAGDYDFINIEYKWGQIILQVRNGTGPAAYRFYAIANYAPQGILS